MARALRCPHCGADLNPIDPECPGCQAIVPEWQRKEPDDPAERARRHRLPIPWSLFVLLGLYLAAVYGYVTWARKTSPEYQAAVHTAAVKPFFDKGKVATATKEELLWALDHLLVVLRHYPNDRWSHERVESVQLQLDLRKVKLQPEVQRELDALSSSWRRMKESRSSVLPIGARDIWDLDRVERLPASFATPAVVGSALIIVLWGWIAWQNRKHLAAQEQERQEARRREIGEAGQHRRRVKTKR